MQEVTLKARTAFCHNVVVDPEPIPGRDGAYYTCELSWNFFTKSKNISFGLYKYRSGGPKGTAGMAPQATISTTSSISSVQGISAHNHATGTPGQLSRKTSMSSNGSSQAALGGSGTLAPGTPFESHHSGSSESLSATANEGGVSSKKKSRFSTASTFRSRTASGGSANGQKDQSQFSYNVQDESGQPSPDFHKIATKSLGVGKAGVPIKSTGTSNDIHSASESLHSTESWYQSASAPRRAKNNPSRKFQIDPDLEEVIPIAHYPSSKDVIIGSYLIDEPATYVLVFDNTYSVKQSKKLSFIVSVQSVNSGDLNAAFAKQLVAGYLLKKANKKMQGFQKRWATIDSRGVFTYYMSPSGHKRGSVALQRCAITIDHDRESFDLDSGDYLYHFKTYNTSDFTKWIQALQNFTGGRFADNLGSNIPTHGYNLEPIAQDTNGEDAADRESSVVTPKGHRKTLSNAASIPPLDGSRSKTDDSPQTLAGVAESVNSLTKIVVSGNPQCTDYQTSSVLHMEELNKHLSALATSLKKFEEVIPTLVPSSAQECVPKIIKQLRDTTSVSLSKTIDEAKDLAEIIQSNNSFVKKQQDSILEGLKTCINRLECLHEGRPVEGGRSAVPSYIKRGSIELQIGVSPLTSNFSLNNRRLSIITSPDSVMSSEVYYDALPGGDDHSSSVAYSTLSGNGNTSIAMEQAIMSNRVLGQAIPNEVEDEEDDYEESDEENETEEVILLDEDEDGTSGSARVSTADNRQTKVRNMSKIPSMGSGAPSSASTTPMSSSTNGESKTDSQKATNAVSKPFRTSLPAPMVSIGNLSLFSLLTGGKDGSFSMPIVLNEPINLLQKMCEELEYSELLDKASDPSLAADKRIAIVSAFCVSAYASTLLRTGRKPFNPMLGETFEFYKPESGWRYFSEKVSHHPPIMASYAEGGITVSNDGNVLDSNGAKTTKYVPKWKVYQESEVTSKFWGKSLELVPEGTLHLEFPELGLHYTWHKVTTCMRNVLSNTRYLEHYGTMNIEEVSKGEFSSSITFKEASYFSSSKNEISGNILNNKGKKVYGLTGFWPQSLSMFSINEPNSQEVIWRAKDFPPNAPDMYGFTDLTVRLNELPDESHPQRNLLPKTDTRYRTDQRIYENGDADGAEAEKKRLEQMQRTIRKDSEWVPRWFVSSGAPPDPANKKKKPEVPNSWSYTGGYWESRGKFSEAINGWELW